VFASSLRARVGAYLFGRGVPRQKRKEVFAFERGGEFIKTETERREK